MMGTCCRVRLPFLLLLLGNVFNAIEIMCTVELPKTSTFNIKRPTFRTLIVHFLAFLLGCSCYHLVVT
uniref:Secreted protein n=1 Tax=Anopheles darlingi TaxID=43151 RepID=A0A2M4D3I3_ANODA